MAFAWPPLNIECVMYHFLNQHIITFLIIQNVLEGLRFFKNMFLYCLVSDMNILMELINYFDL